MRMPGVRDVVSTCKEDHIVNENAIVNGDGDNDDRVGKGEDGGYPLSPTHKGMVVLPSDARLRGFGLRRFFVVGDAL